MRFFLIGLVISLSIFSFVFAQTDSLALTVSITPVQPQDGAETIILKKNSDLTITSTDGAEPTVLKQGFSLLLEPQGVAGATEYHYQYWKKGSPAPELGANELVPPEGIALFIPSSHLEPGATYFWRVRVCTDTTTCGPISSSWSFTYLLPPPTQLISPTTQAAPITLEWTPVQGAPSYNILIKPCPAGFKKELKKEGEDCNELEFLVNDSIAKDDICSLEPSIFSYTWNTSSCLSTEESSCGPSSQSAKITVTTPTSLPIPILNNPLYIQNDPTTNKEIIPIVSPTDFFEWDVLKGCAYEYKLVLRRQGQEITSFTNQYASGLPLSDFPELWDESEDLSKIWTWQVFSCSSATSCAKTGSAPSYFKTIGKKPIIKSPDQQTVRLPATLIWIAPSESSFYRYEIKRGDTILKSNVVSTPQANMLYRQNILEPGQDYSWHVQTCIDEKGKICGEWSTLATFSTYPLHSPVEPEFPKNGGEMFLPGQLIWQEDPGTAFYQYQVQYTNAEYGKDENSNVLYEELAGCPAQAGSIIIPSGGGKLPIVAGNAVSLNTKCLGQYSWQVNSCYDSSCTKTKNGPLWTFTAVPSPSLGMGLIPCERTSSNASTPYDERESCQLKHIGFLFQNILDFILWKLSLIILAALAVFAAASTYFSFGSPNAITNLRSVFRSYLYGFLFLFFAWLFVNIIMALFGFNIEFFGRWWELPF